MPDITTAITYNEALSTTIKQKRVDPQFGPKTWSTDELQGLRTTIRSYYRQVQHGLCAYCKQPVSLQSAANCHVEHIAPKSLYPEFMFEPKNLCVVCADCNEIKRNQEVTATVPDTVKDGPARKRYPRSSAAFKIVHPHFDIYDEHIERIHRFYVDLTPKGHFTIGACRLNRFVQAHGWTSPAYDEASVAQVMTEWLQATQDTEKVAAIKRLAKMLIY